MNIQFPLAALMALQEKTSAGTTAEDQGGTSFAAILGQATQAGQQMVAALPAEHPLVALPKGSAMPSLPFQQRLGLPVELAEEFEPDVAEPELSGLVASDAGVAAAALITTQTMNVTDGQVAATVAVSGEQVMATQRVASEHAQLQQAAAVSGQIQASGHAKAQPVEAAFNLVEQLEVTAKQVTQNPLENTALVSGNNVEQAAAPATARAVLNAPMTSPQWQNDLSQQVSSFVLRGHSRVSLQLNPAELGPLLVELKLVEQSAQLQFVSGQAAVRSAVEQAIPQLRDALAQQGIDLGDVNVGEQSMQREHAQSARSGIAVDTAKPEADEAELVQVELDTGAATLPGQLSVYA